MHQTRTGARLISAARPDCDTRARGRPGRSGCGRAHPVGSCRGWGPRAALRQGWV